jgi:hypothetical protein
MALIPLGSGRFADDPDARLGVNAMRHQNSVFHGLLKHLPWGEFDRLVAVHGADSRVRRLTTKSQFVALLYGQLAGASSLREIVTGLESHTARLYHLGANVVRRSTLADANARRPVAVFAELLAVLMQRAHRGLRRKLAETTYLIDATGVRLTAHSAGWARFSTGVCGAKVHLPIGFPNGGVSFQNGYEARYCIFTRTVAGVSWCPNRSMVSQPMPTAA